MRLRLHLSEVDKDREPPLAVGNENRNLHAAACSFSGLGCAAPTVTLNSSTFCRLEQAVTCGVPRYVLIIYEASNVSLELFFWCLLAVAERQSVAVHYSGVCGRRNRRKNRRPGNGARRSGAEESSLTNGSLLKRVKAGIRRAVIRFNKNPDGE